MADIIGKIDELPLSASVKEHAKAVYGRIAEAESAVHGRPVDQIHFHEVGTMDALADVTAFCLLMEKLGNPRVVVSPIHVGSGHVHCAHGILPVPAPATAFILKGVPSYGGEVKGELCTPTGAALLTHFAAEFGGMPVMRTEKIGCGMGNRDFERLNCVRAFYGESDVNAAEEITELACNIDDMTGEELGGLYEVLTEAGALDVSLIPDQMKKNRPGQLLLCVVRPERAEELAAAILKHTSTIGVRRKDCMRYVLDREEGTAQTKYGPVRYKKSYGFGAEKYKPEWDDLAAIRRECGVSAEEIRRAFYQSIEKK